ncbi:MAG: bifunctional GNAT family N-acetyltransferase/carbon-nitrogen hydrolase family protein [Bacteroidetes bacterium]|nr:bifunctional GNAT family N-acetyltransferase/carbon-nitrogen hydrolase family protein [Bacteroidota bacterium]
MNKPFNGNILKKIKVRKIQFQDYEQIVHLQLLCFPTMKPWNQEQFKNLTKIFPEGQICIEYNGEIIASSCSLVIDSSKYSESSSWKELTDNGYIKNHDETGDTLYGMEMMVHPEYRNMKLARRLYEARKKLAVKINVNKIAIGGRLPNYNTHQNKMNVYDYVMAVTDKKIFDPVLTTQLANGFSLKKVLPDYLPNDKESCGYATYLEWTNFQYRDANERVSSRYVRVAAVQYQMRTVENFEEFASQCEYFVDVASDYRSDFVLFPELITMQLLSFMPTEQPAASARRLSDFTEKYLEFFNNLAIKYNINIIGGSHLHVENENLYNISYLFRRDGSIDKQYKIQITPHEKKWWGVKGGDKIEVFDTDCGKVAIAICYDVQFPELVRIAAAKGAEILFVPYNTDERRGYLRVRYCSQARAIENQMYVVITGCVGNLPKVQNLDIHFSQSAIFTPSDVEFSREGIATEATPNTEMVIYQDLDLRLLKRNREYGTVQHWKDIRNDLFEIIQKNHSAETKSLKKNRIKVS